MKERSRILGLMVVLALLMTAFSTYPVAGEDQARENLEVIATNPSGVTFYDIAWNSDTWEYAIAVGDDGSGNAVVYKYMPGVGWTTNPILSVSNGVFYDVVYDPTRSYSSDHFFVVGTAGSSAAAYKLWDVENAPAGSIQYQDLDPLNGGVSADVFNGAMVDPSYGYLIAVGYDGSNGVGVAAICDYDSGVKWSSNISSPDITFTAVADDYSNMCGVVTGYYSREGTTYGVIYSYFYENNSLLEVSGVPSEVYSFEGIVSSSGAGGNPESDEHILGGEGGLYFVAVGSNQNETDPYTGQPHGSAWVIFPNGTNRYDFVQMTADDPTPPLFNDVDIYVSDQYSSEKSTIMIVGMHGTIYAGYEGNFHLTNWSDPGYTDDLWGVAVKAPHSPGYGLGVGASSSSKISYQVADSSTQIEVNTVYPHLNAIDFRDSSGSSVINQQIDVGSPHYFFINASYDEGWENVELDIYAWYDRGNDANAYDEAQGSNLNFHLHYVPSSDPLTTPGTWTLVYPTTGEVGLIDSNEVIDDNPNGDNPGVSDTKDYFHLYVNITLGEQCRYAPGDGTWDSSPNNRDSSSSFNDADSWNFEIRVYDHNNNGAGQEMYDEFGVYAYTNIQVTGNPSGSGAPGTTIYLDSTDSEVAVQSNRNYYVTVDVTDLTSASGNSISRTNIQVQNSHADNGSAPTDIQTWTAFPSSGSLWVWGSSSGPTYMNPVNYGLYTAGNSYGYDSSTYTPVSWRIVVPAATPEDHFTATITYEISYP